MKKQKEFRIFKDLSQHQIRQERTLMYFYPKCVYVICPTLNPVLKTFETF